MHSDTTVGRRADGVTGSPAQAWPPAGTAWTTDGAWPVDVPWGTPGVARTSDAAARAACLEDLLAALPAPRTAGPTAPAAAAEPSWQLPMAWLAGHLPLTLIMDLSMPFGPHSRELLVEEPPR